MNMNTNVDVLNEMERASSRLFDAGLHGDLSLDEARAAVAELIEALIFARSELSGLPHSLGYSFTHLPKIDAALARVKGA